MKHTKTDAGDTQGVYGGTDGRNGVKVEWWMAGVGREMHAGNENDPRCIMSSGWYKRESTSFSLMMACVSYSSLGKERG